MVQRYLRIEDQKSGPRLVCNQDFAKERGLEPKVEMFLKNVLNCGGVMSKLM